MLGRARLLEHYQRILREDMLTIFDRAADLRSLECSVVLHGTQAMTEETKYRAACVLEVLTGQRVHGRSCNVVHEDPSERTKSETQRREVEQMRGALIQQSVLNARKKNQGKADVNIAVPSELRKLGSGLKLLVTLRKVKMYYFLEKLREFYLPDVVDAESKRTEQAEHSSNTWRPPTSGHDNSHERRGLLFHFQKQGGSKRDCYPPRYRINREENPSKAITTYTLHSTDLAKFPDLEIHFDALGPVLGGGRSDTAGQPLQLILRAALEVSSPLDRDTLDRLPPVDNIRLMNYLLSQYFHAYMHRPHVGT